MKVIKRNGTVEDVSFDKISARIYKVLGDSDLRVDVALIAQKVISHLVDGIYTREIDETTARICNAMIFDDPAYYVLAGKLLVAAHHKETDPSFVQVMEKLAACGLLGDRFISDVRAHASELDAMIVHSRDYKLSYFAMKTLLKSYLLRGAADVLERPAHMWMRVAVQIHGRDLERVAETYTLLSNLEMTHATPTLFNSGGTRAQMASCFLINTEDSLDGIYKTLTDCARISKYAGGIGCVLSDVRSRGSSIRSTNGISDGLLPVLRTFNAVSRHINQAGKRAGSIAMYIEPWHQDIAEFIAAKRNTGFEEDRARDLFYALWVPDLFMHRVRDDGTWTLFDPSLCAGLTDSYGDAFTQLYESYERQGLGKPVRAKDIWDLIISSQIETGLPYMLYKDACNSKSNQKNLGTIKSSNLCVAGSTTVLTDIGPVTIKSAVDTVVNAWNGAEFAPVTVRYTGVSRRLLEIAFSNGLHVQCTPEHKFYMADATEKAAAALCLADQLEPQTFPRRLDVPRNDCYKNRLIYTQAVISVLGNDASVWIDPCGVWEIEIDHDVYDAIAHRLIGHEVVDDSDSDSDTESDSGCYMYKFVIKSGGRIVLDGVEPFLYLLSGMLDSDFDVEPGSKFSLQTGLFENSIGVIGYLQLLGLEPVYANEEVVFDPLRLKPYKHFFERFSFGGDDDEPEPDPTPVTVTSISYVAGKNHDTYCFTEPSRHRGVFNGLLTGQCAEIVEYTSPKYTSTCNLASVALPKCVVNGAFDYRRLARTVGVLVRNLDNVIDKTFYPIDEAEYANQNTRPLGIGVQGLSDVFALLRVPYDSAAAASVNRRIFKTMYYAALRASVELARERGVYPTFKGSPASQGTLQFHLWGKTTRQVMDEDADLGFDWPDLIEQIKRHGLRNSLLLALMPTASTAQILGNSESFEPFNSCIYSRKTMSGEFTVINPHLVKDVAWSKDLAHEIILRGGSIQSIESIPLAVRNLYKTVWELKQKAIVDLCIGRGPYVCQSQSMNLFFETPSYSTLTKCHFYGWKHGLKTGSYYIRTKPALTASNYGIDPVKERQVRECTADVCETCTS